MTAKTKKQPFTTFRFERDPGNTKNHHLYAVEKTEYGTLLFFLENEVLEAKHLFHDTHASIASDGPLMSSDNQAERLFAVLNGSWFMLPDDLQAEDVFMLRLWSVKGLKRCLCTYFNKNNILSMPASVENLPECPEETVIARQLAESDLHHYEIQTKDDQSWIVELLEPRPYTDQEQKRIHGHDNITDTQTAPGEPETDMLTTEQAAEFANVSTKTILNWTGQIDQNDKPMLPGARKVAGKWLIPKADLIPHRKPERKSTEPPKKGKKPTRKNPVKK